MNLNLNKNVEMSEDEIKQEHEIYNFNFSCNQCGNDRQIESELSQECKASGRQMTINKNMAMKYFCK